MQPNLLKIFHLLVIALLPVLVAGTATLAQDGTPSGNGDVDGNGALDINDPLYLLTHMFIGGPEPVPIMCPDCPECPECPQCPTIALPTTDQRACFDDLGQQILCSNQEFPGQDGFHRSGCPSNNRFVDNGNGTVTDTCTGLMWTQDTLNIDAYPEITIEDRVNWKNALQFCHDLSLGGHNDWRLPNIRELESLSYYDDIGPAGPPEVDALFGIVRPGIYWTSTNDMQSPQRAWTVIFESGGSFPESLTKNNPQNIIAVRNSTAP